MASDCFRVAILRRFDCWVLRPPRRHRPCQRHVIAVAENSRRKRNSVYTHDLQGELPPQHTGGKPTANVYPGFGGVICSQSAVQTSRVAPTLVLVSVSAPQP